VSLVGRSKRMGRLVSSKRTGQTSLPPVLTKGLILRSVQSVGAGVATSVSGVGGVFSSLPSLVGASEEEGMADAQKRGSNMLPPQSSVVGLTVAPKRLRLCPGAEAT
jgi:hypothetical protein